MLNLFKNNNPVGLPTDIVYRYYLQDQLEYPNDHCSL